MKGKQISCRILCCLLLIGTLMKAQPVEAAKRTYDPKAKGSIQIQLDDIGTNRENVSFDCYLIGTPKVIDQHLEGWVPQEAYKDVEMDLNKLGDVAVHQKSAKNLVEFIEKDGRQKPVDKRSTNANGVVTFQDLKQGVYLLLQRDQFETYGNTKPFLMTVPYMENGCMIDNVVTQTKGERPDTSEKPSHPGKPDSAPHDPPAKTGDTYSIGVWIAVASGSAAVMIYRLWKKRKESM